MSTVDFSDAWWWPYAFILLAGFLPTSMWRWLGAVAVGNIDEKSEILVLVRCIATALVAAVIAQLVLFPSGATADLPVLLRLGALATGFAAYLASGHRLAFGIVAGEAVLITGILLQP